jgi:glutaminase
MDKTNYQRIIQEIYTDTNKQSQMGILPTYIPELAKINPSKFAINLSTLEGDNYGIGNYSEKFSTQSIGKVYSFTLAYKIIGGEIFKRVGVEPSGDPFNSLIQLELEHGKPRNPFINAGALVVCDVLIDLLDHPEKDLFNFIRKIADNPKVDYNRKVYQSEKRVGYKNKAAINLMKSFGAIQNDTDEVLDLYYKLCSIEMNVQELSHTFLLFANEGKLISTGEEILTKSKTKRLNALMQTCGFYDEAGEFSFKVGLPGKSGVGGGIVAVHPQKYAVAVWSPLLNLKGNSVKGMKALELLTTKLGWSIF